MTFHNMFPRTRDGDPGLLPRTVPTPGVAGLGVHDAGQRVAEDVRVVAVVEPPLQLFEVAVTLSASSRQLSRAWSGTKVN